LVAPYSTDYNGRFAADRRTSVKFKSEIFRPEKEQFAMQINITARHGQLSDASREKIKAKVEKLGKYFERLTSIAVTIDLEHSEHPAVEIQVDAEHKHDFVARESADEMWAALDGAVQKLEQQLRKYKEKVLDRHRQPDAKNVARRPE
jgi:putative sigma-54 modulation protein